LLYKCKLPCCPTEHEQGFYELQEGHEDQNCHENSGISFGKGERKGDRCAVTMLSSPSTVVETHNSCDNRKDHVKVVSFDRMKLAESGGKRFRSISSTTAATAEESLTDEEETHHEDSHAADYPMLQMIVSHIDDTVAAQDEPEAESTSSQVEVPSSGGLPSPTPEHASSQEEEKEEESRCYDDTVAVDRDSKPEATPRRRQSILKPPDMEIPVRNRGWKNLPKADLSQMKLSPVVATRRSCSAPQLKRQVSFQNVEIRCYDQCVGDNPSVSYGTPISLDWSFCTMDPLDLDVYESARGKRRNPRQMMMNYFNRRHLLTLSYGVTEAELVHAEKAATKIRNQRALTRALLPAAKVEDFFTSAARKTKRAMQKKASNPNQPARVHV
jgi:hypothetical protein